MSTLKRLLSCAAIVSMLACGLSIAQDSRIHHSGSLGPQGTVSFIVETPKALHNGPSADNFSIEVFKIDGIGRMRLKQDSSSCTIVWEWDKEKIKGVLPLNTLVPELPAKEKYHFLYTWDSEKGLFYGYFNGIPMRLPGTVVDPWKMEVVPDVVAHLSEWDTSGIQITAAYTPPEKIGDYVPDELQNRHATLIGAPWKKVAMDLSGRLGKKLYQSKLASPESTKGWVLEGPGIIKYESGWMTMASERPNGPDGNIVHWQPDDFPKSFVAEWEMQILSEDGLCIVFFSAKGNEGQDIFDPSLPKREGIFKRYNRGAISCYHISYFSNNPKLRPGRITSNLRKNPGAFLVANGPVGIEPNSDKMHKVRLVRDDAHIQLTVDGKVAIDYVDKGDIYGPVHGGGKIGLRQMQWTVARYRNFKIWELLPR